LLVALWLCACIRGIGSARELARRCKDSAGFHWLCGGVTVNHRLLSDFRSDHGAALDELFTQVVASLVDKDVVRVSRVSQDGVRVSAGASSFRCEERLEQAIRQLPELKQKQAEAARRAGHGQRGGKGNLQAARGHQRDRQRRPSHLSRADGARSGQGALRGAVVRAGP
jgi:hypothetical protein